MKRILSKLISIIIAVAMVISSSVFAFAANSATNNYGSKDTVTVDTTAGQQVNVYKGDLNTANGTVKIASGKATGSTLTLTGNFGTTSGGSVYVAISTNSAIIATITRSAISFNPEPQSAAVSSSAVTVSNNVRIADTVKVTGLTAGDKVTAYKTATATDTASYGYAIVGAGKSEAVISISNGKLSSAGGSIWVAVRGLNKNESQRVEISYGAEAVTTTPASIEVVNNAVIKDTVKVSNVTGGAIVKIYSDAEKKTVLATKSIAKGATSAAISTTLSSSGGSIYVTVMDKDKLESGAAKVDYNKEGITVTSAQAIFIDNSSTSGGSIVIAYKLKMGDTVKVYSDSGKVTLLKTGKVANKQSQVVISLPAAAKIIGGKVYVTVTTAGYTESAVISVDGN